MPFWPDGLRAFTRKRHSPGNGDMFGSTDPIELQGHGALFVSGRVLVENTLRHSLIDLFHRNLVSAIGIGAIALRRGGLERSRF